MSSSVRQRNGFADCGIFNVWQGARVSNTQRPHQVLQTTRRRVNDISPSPTLNVSEKWCHRFGLSRAERTSTNISKHTTFGGFFFSLLTPSYRLQCLPTFCCRMKLMRQTFVVGLCNHKIVTIIDESQVFVESIVTNFIYARCCCASANWYVTLHVVTNI